MQQPIDHYLEKYAELALKVGLNLQPGQPLLVPGRYTTGMVPFAAAPLVRKIAARAYDMGAPLVDVLWGDPQLMLLRFKHAPPESFETFPAWLADAQYRHASEGGALLSIHASDPGLLSGQDAATVSKVQAATARHLEPLSGLISRSATNWTVIAAAVPGWAARVFPDAEPDEQVDRLWQAIFHMCRLDQADPIAAWQDHLLALGRRREYLAARKFSALHYTGPGTDLRVGLPDGHKWLSADEQSAAGHRFTANIPTEEVFTLPHKDMVDGEVSATLPLSYAGNLIEDIRLVFADGRVVAASASRGEDVLHGLLETDAGARRLGEVALVAHSSPISQSGLLLYNTLYDENASCHLALGRAYNTCLVGGGDMSRDQFQAAGGNHSLLHVDFMIGSAQLDVDGLLASGERQPIMRQGEWAFDT